MTAAATGPKKVPIDSGRGTEEHMDEKGKLNLLSNPRFLAYVEGLPTIERRILSMPGPDGGAEYLVSLRETGVDGPPEVRRYSDKEK
jgi:hypothetical protein